MRLITITLAVEDADEIQVRADVMNTLAARDTSEGGGRPAPWIPGGALLNVRSAAVDGVSVFTRLPGCPRCLDTGSVVVNPLWPDGWLPYTEPCDHEEAL